MRKIALSLALLAIAATVHAAPVYNTSVLVPYDPTAPSNNFGSSASTLGSNTTAYTVRTGSDATNFYVDIAAPTPPSTDISGLQFANIYVGGLTFSGLVFELPGNDVLNLGGSQRYSLVGTGVTYSQSTNDFSLVLPYSFLETDPLGMGFSKVNPGDQLRISYSQSFGYTSVGGNAYNNIPMVNNTYGSARLGQQFVPNAVPEPGSFALGGLGLLGLGVIGYRRRQAAA